MLRKQVNNSDPKFLAYSFKCPGCKEYHSIRVQRGDNESPNVPCWGFNGNLEKPTFTPSILDRQGHYVDGNKDCWCNFKERFPDYDGELGMKCHICHSFVTDGKIMFLGDSTHELAGMTVDLFSEKDDEE